MIRDDRQNDITTIKGLPIISYIHRESIVKIKSRKYSCFVSVEIDSWWACCFYRSQAEKFAADKCLQLRAVKIKCDIQYVSVSMIKIIQRDNNCHY